MGMRYWTEIALEGDPDLPWGAWREQYPVFEDSLQRLTGKEAHCMGSATGCSVSFHVPASSAEEAFIVSIAFLNRVAGAARMPRWPVTAISIRED
jgi:hypothetical protein